MTLLYNILQLLLSPLILSLLLLGLVKKKNRKKIPQRLGRSLPKRELKKPTIWVHALSVGEINSSLPLIRSLHEELVNHRIVVSASTVAGKKRAEEILAPYADYIIGAPFDFLPIIAYYIHRINPHIYIQVETDFWPNILWSLKGRDIPRILVNGRISKKSMHTYRRFAFFFQPLFNSYNTLSMQTQSDVSALLELGISQKRTAHLGNLKFAHEILAPKRTIPKFYKDLCAAKKIIVAGSTHPGEEDILCASFKELQKRQANSLLFIAPRNIERKKEILHIAKKHGLTANYRSQDDNTPADIYIIDTIGELMQFYMLADLCFVGGSLVDFGGHNPIEPASLQKATIFGPYMGSFTEITPLLINANAAQQVTAENFSKTLQTLLFNERRLKEMGVAAQELVYIQQQGILSAHLKCISDLLQHQ